MVLDAPLGAHPGDYHTTTIRGASMTGPELQPIIDRMHAVCGDTSFTKEESRDAYAEMEEAAATARAALDEEIAVEGEDECEMED